MMAFCIILWCIAWQVMVPPIIGLADNADYLNLTAPMRLEPDAAPEDRFFSYLVQDYMENPQASGLFRLAASDYFVLAPGLWLKHSLMPEQPYDIRWAGVTHALIWLFALALILPCLERLGKAARIVVLGALVLVAVDVAYVSYFNSLYTDAGSLVFLILLLSVHLRLGLSVGSQSWNAKLALIVLVLLVSSKPQHSLLAFPLIVHLWLWRQRFFEGRLKELVAYSVGLAALALFCFRSTPPGYRDVAVYNVIFLSILPKFSNDPAVVADLRLPLGYGIYVGRSAFDAHSGFSDPGFSKEFQAEVSHTTLLRLYLLHPKVAVAAIADGLRMFGSPRPGFGNFTKNAKKGPGAESRSFSWWSDLKRVTLFKRPLAALAVILLVLGGPITLAARFHAQWLPTILVLAGMAVWEFLLAVLADCAETNRHLLIFHMLFDSLFLCMIAMAAQHWLRSPQARTVADDWDAKAVLVKKKRQVAFST